jgi:hypothetical protein
MVTVLIDFLMEILIIEDGLFYKVSGFRCQVSGFPSSLYRAAPRQAGLIVTAAGISHLAAGQWLLAAGYRFLVPGSKPVARSE